MSRKPARPWALGSGPGFWGCFTWRLFRNGWSANTIWICWLLPPVCSTRLSKTDGETIIIDNPADMPDPTYIDTIAEPWMHISVYTPADYIGSIMEITTRRRGEFIKMEYLDETRVLMEYYLPPVGNDR